MIVRDTQMSNIEIRQVEEIYRAYPRHVGKKAAIPKILKALRELTATHPDAAHWLLTRVAAYAKAVEHAERKYIPYPATWFHQGRYDDDDEEWSVGIGDAGGQQGPDSPALGFLDKIEKDQAAKAEQERLKKELREAF